jgi:hypothetical protein
VYLYFALSRQIPCQAIQIMKDTVHSWLDDKKHSQPNVMNNHNPIFPYAAVAIVVAQRLLPLTRVQFNSGELAEK